MNDKDLPKRDKERKMKELTKALQVLGVKPSTFHCHFTNGRTAKVAEMFEQALANRTKEIVYKKIRANYNFQDPNDTGYYNPHINKNIDLPTLHEAFQYLMKV